MHLRNWRSCGPSLWSDGKLMANLVIRALLTGIVLRLVPSASVVRPR